MPNSGAAHSSEFKVFETEEFKKAFARLGPPRFLAKKLDAYGDDILRVLAGE